MTSKNEATLDIWQVQNAPMSKKKTPEFMPNKMEQVQNQPGLGAKPDRENEDKTVMGNLHKMMEICRLCPHYEELNEVGGCVRDKGKRWTRLDNLDHCPKVIQIRRGR